MNEKTKAQIANVFTATVAVITIVQGSMLRNPPLSDNAIQITGTIFTYLALGLTAWKQYLSPDVNTSGQKTTFWIAAIATVGGLSDLVGIFSLSDVVQQYISLGISVLVTILNVVSKQLFPSFDQKVKMEELKVMPPKSPDSPTIN